MNKSGSAWQKKWFLSFVLGCLATLCFGESELPESEGLPMELRQGLLQFEVDRGDYLSALALLDARDQNLFPVAYASALSGFEMDKESIYAQLERALAKGDSLSSVQQFQIGKIYYHHEDCIPSLKALKGLSNKLSLEDKQEWAFYRANCSIKLGSTRRAAQVLSDLLSGLWVAHAYYNLAMAYNAASTNKTKALVALRVASSLNTGKSRIERELNDRIFYAAGSLYLESEKPRFGSDFLKKINLDSMIAPQALYLHGLALLEQKDFRAATQSWFSVKKYPTIHQGVAESLLAIPYAYEGAGYVSQALEAYLEASDSFKKELTNIRKLQGLLEKYGARKVLIEESKLAELEWFLAKDVATNTKRAAYFTYLTEDEATYDLIARMSELQQLFDKLQVWQNELAVYDKSLKKKTGNYGRQSKSFSKLGFEQKIKSLSRKVAALESKRGQGASPLLESKDELYERLKQVKQAISKGGARLKSQRAVLSSYRKQVEALKKRLSKLIDRYDAVITELSRERFEQLEQRMVTNFEKAEQGLVHILETIAETNNPIRNRLDGRYQ